MPTENQRKVAEHFGGQFTNAMLRDMPALEDGVRNGGHTTFTVTVAIRETKEGDIVGKLKPRTRHPGQEIETRLSFSEQGQLELFG